MNHQQNRRPMPASTPVNSPPPKKKTNKKFFVIIAGIIIGGLLFSTYYFWQKYRKILKNPNIVAQEEVKGITEKIQKFMDLPEGETPDLAKVSNKEKLEGQPFFQKSQNGDVVLIYLKAKRAILYRPSTNRVIDMVPLSEGALPPAQNPAPENNTTEQK
jgi:hypothetical protein